MLPESTDAASPQKTVAEFRGLLRTVTPRVWLVPALVAVDVAVFGLMVVRGVSPFAPRARDLVAWGANFGPATLSGEPWRLLANAFLHFGALHLAMNMVALWDAGRLTERIFGQARLATIYLGAAVCGSATSLLVHPQVVSAGASGAVFGVYGAIAGFLLRERRAIPAPVLSRLKRVALPFIAYNLLFGLVMPGVDAAAHVGGVVAGTLAGAFLSRPLVANRKGGGGRVLAVATAACLAAFAAPSAVSVRQRLVPLEVRRFPGFAVALPSGTVLDTSDAYAAGRFVLRAGDLGRTLVVILWKPGDPPSRQELASTAEELGASLHVAGAARTAAVRGPRGLDVDTVSIGERGAGVRLSALRCGRRNLYVAVGGSIDPGELHGRALASFECRPDPQLEASVDLVPVKLDLAGWVAAGRGSGHVVVSDGRSTVLLRSWPIPSSATIEEIAVDAASALGGAHVDARASGQDMAAITGTVGGRHVDGWVRALRCPTSGVLLTFVAPDPASAERLRAAGAGARCTAPGEAPSSWPDGLWPGEARPTGTGAAGGAPGQGEGPPGAHAGADAPKR